MGPDDGAGWERVEYDRGGALRVGGWTREGCWEARETDGGWLVRHALECGSTTRRKDRDLFRAEYKPLSETWWVWVRFGPWQRAILPHM